MENSSSGQNASSTLSSTTFVSNELTTAESGMDENTFVASVVFICLLFVILALSVAILALLCYRRYRRIHNPKLTSSISQANLTDQDVLATEANNGMSADNLAYNEEEGGGEEDNQTFDLSKLKVPAEGRTEKQAGETNNNVFTTTKSSPLEDIDNLQLHGTSSKEATDNNKVLNKEQAASIREYLTVSLKAADEDDTIPTRDETFVYSVEMNFPEGSCQLSELSAISSESQDLEFAYLNDWGAPFRALADLYEVGSEKNPAGARNEAKEQEGVLEITPECSDISRHSASSDGKASTVILV